MPKTATQRDVTRAIALVDSLDHVGSYRTRRVILSELRELLVAIDARTGRRDPSKRVKKSARKR